MSILEILNNVLSQSGFHEKASFFNSQDLDDKQMAAIANRVGYEILNFYRWPLLRVSHEIDLQAGEESYTLPADFQSLVPDSVWEADGSRIAEWPTPDGRWYMYKFSAFSVGGVARIKMHGSTVDIINDGAASVIEFEYITNAYAKAESSGDLKAAFTLDTDTFRLDDQLLILGIQAHWQQAKGIPTYQEHYANYMNKMREAIARAAAGRTIGGRSGVNPVNADPDSPYYPLYRGS
jgi:hypothetical protein